jgi:alpha-tubulin suppressor-like RCC1 family protein
MFRSHIQAISVVLAFTSAAMATDAGRVIAWGNVNPQAVPNVSNALDVDMGSDFGAIVTADGSVQCWGGNSWSGNTNVPAGLQAVEIACGSDHTVARRANGTVACWGDNSYDQCAAPTDLTCRNITAGYIGSIAIRADGTVVTWGSWYSNYGRLEALRIPGSPNGVKQASVGYSSVMILRDNGRVYAFGPGISGETVVPLGLSATQIASGRYFSAALTTARTVVCWGDNSSRQCEVPAYVQDVVQIEAGSSYCVALLATGAVECWGGNSYGQCMPPIELTSASLIAAGEVQAAAIAGSAPPISCPGDFDGDGEVTTADISLMLLSFGPCS